MYVFLSVECIVTFSQASYTVTEGDRLRFGISIVIGNSSRDSFSIQILGTGLPPLEIAIPNGTISVITDLLTDEDNICEVDQTFALTFDESSLPDDCAVGNPGSVTVTVKDDEGVYNCCI